MLEGRSEHHVNDIFYRGICTTRDFSYAVQWGDFFGLTHLDAILVLDKEKIQNNHKIVPIHFRRGIVHNNYNDEKEEFILGNLTHLHTYLEKIIMSENVYNVIRDKAEYTFIIDNPKLKVIYDPKKYGRE